MLPAATQTEYLGELLSAPGYLGELYLATLTPDASTFVNGAFLNPDSFETTLLGSDAGFTYPDATHGFMFVKVYGPTTGVGAAGASVTLSNGANAVYTGSDGTPDPELTATTTSPVVLFGNLAPGPVELTVTAPGMTCTVQTGGILEGDWPPMATGATAAAEIAPAALTDNITVFCM